MKTLVRCLRLSGVYDHLNGPNLCCLEEITRRVCQLDEACERGARQVIHQRAIQLQQHRACVHEEFSPSGRQRRRSKLRISVSVPPRPCLFFKMVSGRVLPLLTCLLRNRIPRGKGKKGPRQLTAASADPRRRTRPVLSKPPTRAALALSGRPRSNIGFRSSTLTLRFQRWLCLKSL